MLRFLLSSSIEVKSLTFGEEVGYAGDEDATRLLTTGDTETKSLLELLLAEQRRLEEQVQELTRRSAALPDGRQDLAQTCFSLVDRQPHCQPRRLPDRLWRHLRSAVRQAIFWIAGPYLVVDMGFYHIWRVYHVMALTMKAQIMNPTSRRYLVAP